MKKNYFSIIILFYSFNCFAQTRLEYGNLLTTNSQVRWAGEANVLLNLKSTVSQYSVKKAILNELKSYGLKVYNFTKSGHAASEKNLTYSQFTKARFDTLKSRDFSNRSYFEIIKSKTTSLNCLCDTFTTTELLEIFKVKQVITYKNAELFVRNISIAPLCLKSDEFLNNPGILPIWNILFNVGFNNSDRLKPKTKDLIYLGYDDSFYDFKDKIEGKLKGVSSAIQLARLIFDDCKKGSLKLFDATDNMEIPYQQLAFSNVEKSSIPYDTLWKKAGITNHIPQRNLDSLHRFNIKQELYFDKKKMTLVSVVKSIDILEPQYTLSGIEIGYAPRFRFYSNKTK